MLGVVGSFAAFARLGRMQEPLSTPASAPIPWAWISKSFPQCSYDVCHDHQAALESPVPLICATCLDPSRLLTFGFRAQFRARQALAVAEEGPAVRELKAAWVVGEVRASVSAAFLAWGSSLNHMWFPKHQI